MHVHVRAFVHVLVFSRTNTRKAKPNWTQKERNTSANTYVHRIIANVVRANANSHIRVDVYSFASVFTGNDQCHYAHQYEHNAPLLVVFVLQQSVQRECVGTRTRNSSLCRCVQTPHGRMLNSFTSRNDFATFVHVSLSRALTLLDGSFGKFKN